MIDITKEQFEFAEKTLRGKIFRTPIVPLTTKSERSTSTPQNQPILLKAECLQLSGSFKIRGATYRLSLHTEEERERGVIAYSTGNHAKAVAYAAKLLGIQAVIVMSPEAPAHKVSAVKSYGAEVIMVDTHVRQQVTEELSRTKGYYLVPPFDHPEIITGQGTIGVEILHELEPAAVFVPVGGGGLIAGIAMAIKKLNPQVKIIGVEPELENDGYQSFHSGTLVSLKESSHSIADAIKVLQLGDLTFPIIQHYVDDMVTVSEKAIAEATLLAHSNAHLVVEPAGALGIAAALSYSKPLDSSKPVVAVVSGGNTTLDYLYDLQRMVK
jgi:threonine dehydratase